MFLIKKSKWIGPGIVTAALMIISSASGQVSTQVVTYDGQPAPGAIGAAFSTLYSPVRLNNNGEVVFLANIQGVGIDPNSMNLVSGSAGNFTLHARTGTGLPVSPPNYYLYNLSLQGPLLSDGGAVAFIGRMRRDNPFSELSGIWLNDSAQYQGSSVGGFGTINIGGGGGLYLNGSGLVALRVDSPTDPFTNAIVVGTPGLLNLIAKGGGQAPGLPAGVTFVNTNNAVSAPAGLNENGAALYWGGLQGPGVTTANSSAVFLNQGLVARGDDQVPGLPAGVKYNGLPAPSSLTNTAGMIITGQLTGPGVTSSNNVAYLAGLPGTFTVVARKGDPAPTFPAGVTMSTVLIPVLSSSRKVAFVASLAGPGIITSGPNTNSQIMYYGEPGALYSIVRMSDSAPGEPGKVFVSLLTPDINAQGHLMINATVANYVGASPTKQVYYFFSAETGLIRLIAKDDAVTVAPGDVRVVSSVNFKSHGTTEDGFGSGFNNYGQAAFRVGFVGGSGAILLLTPTLCSPASITQQPVSQAVCAGQPASFSVVASMQGTPNYQWRRNGSTIPGATDPTYTLAAAGTADVGSYDVIITNACDLVTSNVASLTVWAVGTGDTNGDGVTNGLDTQGMANAMMSGTSPSPAFCAADLNASGAVDLADAAMFVNQLLGI